MRFSSAIATATCFLASTSWPFMSTRTWLSIFSGSSARLISSLMFERIRVPSRPNSPILGLRGRPGVELPVREFFEVVVERHRQVVDDRLKFVGVEVLGLQGAGQHHTLAFDCIGVVHEVAVELEQGPVQRLAVVDLLVEHAERDREQHDRIFDLHDHAAAMLVVELQHPGGRVELIERYSGAKQHGLDIVGAGGHPAAPSRVSGPRVCRADAREETILFPPGVTAARGGSAKVSASGVMRRFRAGAGRRIESMPGAESRQGAPWRAARRVWGCPAAREQGRRRPCEAERTVGTGGWNFAKKRHGARVDGGWAPWYPADLRCRSRSKIRRPCRANFCHDTLGSSWTATAAGLVSAGCGVNRATARAPMLSARSSGPVGGSASRH